MGRHRLDHPPGAQNLLAKGSKLVEEENHHGFGRDLVRISRDANAIDQPRHYPTWRRQAIGSLCYREPLPTN
jgi:hypothetical protein